MLDHLPKDFNEAMSRGYNAVEWLNLQAYANAWAWARKRENELSSMKKPKAWTFDDEQNREAEMRACRFAIDGLAAAMNDINDNVKRHADNKKGK